MGKSTPAMHREDAFVPDEVLVRPLHAAPRPVHGGPRPLQPSANGPSEVRAWHTPRRPDPMRATRGRQEDDRTTGGTAGTTNFCGTTAPFNLPTQTLPRPLQTFGPSGIDMCHENPPERRRSSEASSHAASASPVDWV